MLTPRARRPARRGAREAIQTATSSASSGSSRRHRRSTDLIKSGGFKIGAGEIEGALLEHDAVAEAAVTAEPDADLGERIVAWVVLRPEATATAEELVAHVAELLSPHKRPRDVRFLGELPRNDMGKIRKTELTAATVGGNG